MVSLASLWLPIFASAAAVFAVSTAVHMLFTYHEGDLREVSNEDAVRSGLKEGKLPPGEYLIPYAEGSEKRQSDEYVQKLKEGPVAFLTVQESGPIEMGGDLARWFVYCVVMGVFLAYGFAFPQDGIFYGKP